MVNVFFRGLDWMVCIYIYVVRNGGAKVPSSARLHHLNQCIHQTHLSL